MPQTFSILITDNIMPDYIQWLTTSISVPSSFILIFIISEQTINVHDPVGKLYLLCLNEKILDEEKQKAAQILCMVEKRIRENKKFEMCVFKKIVICGDVCGKVYRCLNGLAVDMVIVDGGCKWTVERMWKGSVMDVVDGMDVPVLRMPGNKLI